METAEDLEFFDDVKVENTKTHSSRFRFRTLYKALKYANLRGALFVGTKTLYAPSDAAFAKLGLDEHNICDAIDEGTFAAILLYHIVDDKVRLRERGCLNMLNGDVSQLKVKRRRLFINDSRIYAKFNQRGHGYKLRVYVIDEVLTLPTYTIVETAIATGGFDALVAAVLAADEGITAALSDPDQVWTVFAPTDAAFNGLVNTLGASDLNDLVQTIEVEALSTVLLYHVVDGCAFSNDQRDGLELTTLQGESAEIDLNNLSIIDKSNKQSGLVPEGLDIITSNGIIHSIDKVLLLDAILQAL